MIRSNLVRALLLFGFGGLIAAPVLSEQRVRSFEIEASSLDANYVGQPFSLVLEDLQSAARTPTKREFETTAEFERRRAQHPTYDSIHAFQVATSTEYDADAAVLNVSPFITLAKLPRGGDIDAMQQANHYSQDSPYLIQNIFGATVLADSATTTSHLLGAISPVSKRPRTDLRSIRIALPVAVSAAKALKPNIRLLAIMRVTSTIMPEQHRRMPFISSVSATFESPKGENHIVFTMIGELLQLWVYDLPSGEVLHKLVVPQS